MVKLIIWDLDETLWHGTLADGDTVSLFDGRADLVRRLNDHGVLSSICSKNDAAAARDRLEAFGIWDQFVFPRIAFEPKADAVAAIITDMQLRAPDVLFVDDNPINLEAVRFRLPDIQLLDIREPDSEAALEAIFTSQSASRNRVAEYRNLERKRDDRSIAAGSSDEDFLRACEIKVCAPHMMASLDFVERIVDLINRSNQLNYTNSRVDADGLRYDLVDGYLDYISCSVFAQDKYGDHGLIGFAMIHRRTQTFKHFVFSCRIMHMGLERFVVDELFVPLFPNTVIPEDWEARLRWSKVDWIERLSYDDPDTREQLYRSQGQSVARDAALRIMCACQSGGLAHYSRFRDQIDFDLFPRLFSLADFDKDDVQVTLPPFVVYGTGTGYGSETWPLELLPFLDDGLYRRCVMRMGAYLTERDIQALIFLPPTNLRDDQYGRQGATLIRTIMYNQIWREAAAVFTCLILVEIETVCPPEDMVDVNHHRPAALQTISSLIDVWYNAMTAGDDSGEDHRLVA